MPTLHLTPPAKPATFRFLIGALAAVVFVVGFVLSLHQFPL